MCMMKNGPVESNDDILDNNEINCLLTPRLHITNRYTDNTQKKPEK